MLHLRGALWTSTSGELTNRFSYAYLIFHYVCWEFGRPGSWCGTGCECILFAWQFHYNLIFRGLMKTAIYLLFAVHQFLNYFIYLYLFYYMYSIKCLLQELHKAICICIVFVCIK